MTRRRRFITSSDEALEMAESSCPSWDLGFPLTLRKIIQSFRVLSTASTIPSDTTENLRIIPLEFNTSGAHWTPGQLEYLVEEAQKYFDSGLADQVKNRYDIYRGEGVLHVQRDRGLRLETLQQARDAKSNRLLSLSQQIKNNSCLFHKRVLKANLF